MATPTSRTLAYLREQEHIPWVVETWNSFTHTRTDLYGFADILSFDGSGVYLWQATSTGNMSARVSKIRENSIARQWIGHPSRFLYVIGWKKYAKAKDRKFWRPTIKLITEELWND